MELSNLVRELASTKYVRPALEAGKSEFSVAVKDVLRDLVAKGFPPANTPQVCSALRKKSFLADQGIEIESIDGPPSKLSTTVVYHYRVVKPRPAESKAAERVDAADIESPQARALQAAERLRGFLKEEMAAYGGAEGFIRWVRGYDEENAG